LFSVTNLVLVTWDWEKITGLGPDQTEQKRLPCKRWIMDA